MDALGVFAFGDDYFAHVLSEAILEEVKELQPHGVPFPKDETIRFWKPGDFARFAERARRASAKLPI